MSQTTQIEAPPPCAAFNGLQTVRLLGRGMSGEVFEVRNPVGGERFAVKRLKPQAARHLDLVRFVHEAELMRRLRHPNIMPVLHVQTETTPPYFVMPFREGLTLSDRLHEGRLPVPLVTRIARDAACGLVEAHRHGIVHRDVKPGNLFLERSGRTVILDFGLAKDLTRTEVLTAVGSLLGTPAYMAPEMCRGERVTAKADVYSLGVTIIELVIGQNPYAAPDLVETFRRHLEETPRRLDALLPARVCPELGELVHRMIAKDPSHRPALESCLETFAGLARRFESDARRSTRCSNRPVSAN